MRTAGYLIAASALFFQVTSANAAVLFDWSYTSGGQNPTFSGSGTLTATADATTSGAYDVQSIMGTANGVTITGLDHDYSSPDQLVYFGPGQTAVVDYIGLSFTTANNVSSIWKRTWSAVQKRRTVPILLLTFPAIRHIAWSVLEHQEIRTTRTGMVLTA